MQAEVACTSHLLGYSSPPWRFAPVVWVRGVRVCGCGCGCTTSIISQVRIDPSDEGKNGDEDTMEKKNKSSP